MEIADIQPVQLTPQPPSEEELAAKQALEDQLFEQPQGTSLRVLFTTQNSCYYLQPLALNSISKEFFDGAVVANKFNHAKAESLKTHDLFVNRHVDKGKTGDDLLLTSKTQVFKLTDSVAGDCKSHTKITNKFAFPVATTSHERLSYEQKSVSYTVCALFNETLSKSTNLFQKQFEKPASRQTDGKRAHQEISSPKKCRDSSSPKVTNSYNNVRIDNNSYNQKRERQEREKERDGSSGRQHQEPGEQEHDQYKKDKNGPISEISPKEFIDFASSDSLIFSELFQMRVSHFDVLILFIEVLKLAIKGREIERASRMDERRLQLEHMSNLVSNFKQQGKWMLFTSIGSGVLSIASGALPIVGFMKGESLLNTFKPIFRSLEKIEDHNKLFKSLSKITFSMSEMYKSTGQIQNTYSESSRVYDQTMLDIYKTHWEEDTRSMDEIKDQWKNIEQFLYQALQMHHDAIRQLYSYGH